MDTYRDSRRATLACQPRPCVVATPRGVRPANSARPSPDRAVADLDLERQLRGGGRAVLGRTSRLRRRADLLTRLVGDIDGVQDLFVRALSPPPGRCGERGRVRRGGHGLAARRRPGPSGRADRRRRPAPRPGGPTAAALIGDLMTETRDRSVLLITRRARGRLQPACAEAAARCGGSRPHPFGVTPDPDQRDNIRKPAGVVDAPGSAERPERR